MVLLCLAFNPAQITYSFDCIFVSLKSLHFYVRHFLCMTRPCTMCSQCPCPSPLLIHRVGRDRIYRHTLCMTVYFGDFPEVPYTRCTYHIYIYIPTWFWPALQIRNEYAYAHAPSTVYASTCPRAAASSALSDVRVCHQ